MLVYQTGEKLKQGWLCPNQVLRSWWKHTLNLGSERLMAWRNKQSTLERITKLK